MLLDSRSLSLWRHMAQGGLGAYARKLDQGLGVLAAHRAQDKGWRRFPFFYTLSVLAELDLPNARKQARAVLGECERRLPKTRTATEFGKRRALVLQRVLERHG